MGGDPAFPSVVPPPSYLQDSVWKLFVDPFTDVLKGQLVEDQYERYYFCSPTTGPMFNTYTRLQAGQADYRLGVPGPNVVLAADGSNPDRPTIAVSGGTAPTTTRAYTYTWVNEFGEGRRPLCQPSSLVATPTASGPLATSSNRQHLPPTNRRG